MIKFKYFFALTLAASLSNAGFAGKSLDSWENSQQFKKSPSVLPQGARLVAGNASKNEFYILGRMSVQPEQPPAAKKLIKPHVASTHAHAKRVAKQAKKVASKHTIRKKTA